MQIYETFSFIDLIQCDYTVAYTYKVQYESVCVCLRIKHASKASMRLWLGDGQMWKWILAIGCLADDSMV